MAVRDRLSRLVVDPERFPDEREELYDVDIGAVYTHTSGGLLLRDPDEQAESALLTRFFTPYADALAAGARRISAALVSILGA